MSGIRVLLADDHLLVAEGLKSLLQDEFDLVGTVVDGRALLDAARKLKPDIIVTDISMPLLNGLDALRLMKKEGQPARVIFLTMHRDPQLAAEAFRAGASGYLLKHAASAELVVAIREIAKGRSYVTPLVAKDVLTLLMDADAIEADMELTPRRREILQLIAEGKTMKEVGKILNISTRTVESHKYEIMHLIGAKSTAELIQYAIRKGVVEIDQTSPARSKGAGN